MLTHAESATFGLVALGTVSYAAYLWNLPIPQWLGDPGTLGTGLMRPR
jgi:peptidoglycan/LPS O-acetylase OafA/YrhL